jgi:N utilization substance protein B
MKRRRAREYALQILFQIDITNDEFTEEMFNEFWEGNEEDKEVRDFTRDIVLNTLNNLNKIDDLIQKCTDHWTLQRMAVIDRNILRAATSELLFRPDIPHTVTINEAIEVAKKYSTEDSASFINGILDRIAKEVKKGEEEIN